MKPIIIDMNEMSDSVIMYEARPNKGIKYYIYVVLAAIAVAVIWMSIFKLDIVVKSNGIFRQKEPAHTVSVEAAGVLDEIRVADGDFVEKGDVIAIIKSDNLIDTIKGLEEKITSLSSHKLVLEAYIEYLDGNESKLEEYADNQFYNDIKVRAELLKAQINKNKSDIKIKDDIYKTNIENASKTVEQYNNQISKLEEMRNCIYNRTNSFTTGDDSYYSSIVYSYIDNYNSTELSYNNKITEIDASITSIESQLKDTPDIETYTELNNKITEAKISRNSVINEKNSSLLSLESQQISTLEQQLQAAKDSKRTAEASLASVKAEESASKASDSTESRELTVISEKSNVNTELSEIKRQLQEYETELSGYNIQNEKCEIKAGDSGIVNISQDFKTGSFIEQGVVLANIYPNQTDLFYADVYVDNQDIGKIETGQKVTFEVAAFPSNEYGYFTGKVETISKDIRADENTGNAYYYVKVACDNDSLINKNGEEGKLMNGMACQAKLIIDRQSVMQYVLRKLDLFG